MHAWSHPTPEHDARLVTMEACRLLMTMFGWTFTTGDEFHHCSLVTYSYVMVCSGALMKVTHLHSNALLLFNINSVSVGLPRLL